MIEEFEDVELPPDNPDEWKECPSCDKLRTTITSLMIELEVKQMHELDARSTVWKLRDQITELNKDAEYTIKVLKERQMLRLALDKIKHKTTVYQSAGHICDAKVDNDAIHQIAKAALGEK